jgi:hypothetical protein
MNKSEPAQTYGPPARLQVEPASVVSPSPGAGRSSGLRACRPSPTSYFHCFPATKGQCMLWNRSRLPLRGSPGVTPGSLLLAETSANQHGRESIFTIGSCQERTIQTPPKCTKRDLSCALNDPLYRQNMGAADSTYHSLGSLVVGGSFVGSVKIIR